MKLKKTSLVILAILIVTLSTACQDRLIVLWDETPNIQCHDSFMVNMYESQVPQDIVMVVDNSGSMGEEVAAVRSYINNLSNQMESSSIDYRFVLISVNNGAYGITVPPPLGTSSKFKHINYMVGSWSALADICSQYPNYSSFLRNEATLNFIIVSDDDSLDMSYSAFKSQMTSLGKPVFKMHGIVGLYNHTNVYSIGQEYITGANETGGVQLDITTPANQWGQLFDKLSDNMIEEVETNIYFLTDKPVINNQSSPEDSFTLYIDGNEIQSQNNWQYNQSNNSIVFSNTSLLNADDLIEIEYVKKP